MRRIWQIFRNYYTKYYLNANPVSQGTWQNLYKLVIPTKNAIQHIIMQSFPNQCSEVSEQKQTLPFFAVFFKTMHARNSSDLLTLGCLFEKLFYNNSIPWTIFHWLIIYRRYVYLMSIPHASSFNLLFMKSWRVLGDFCDIFGDEICNSICNWFGIGSWYLE